MRYEMAHTNTIDYFVSTYGSNYNVEPHLHSCFEFILSLSGELFVTVDDTTYSLKEGEAVLLFPHQMHALASTSNELFYIIFSDQLVNTYYSNLRSVKPRSNKFRPDSCITDLLLNSFTTSDILLKKGLLYLLCHDFDTSSEYIANIDYAKYSSILKECFQFVDANFKKKCSLKELAQFVGVDYAYLSRLFKKTTGISYNKFLNTTRLNHATHLLLSSNITITECALECGFDSVRSFNRNFKDYYQLTPSEWLLQRNECDTHQNGTVSDNE